MAFHLIHNTVIHQVKAQKLPIIQLFKVMDKYKYSALPDDEDSIRLLYVHPVSDANEPIICHLLTKKLSDRPKYLALSYTWGEPIFNHTILVSLQGHKLYITANLDRSIRAFRRSGGKLLWADQVCINQDDAREKEKQIPLMRQIYQESQQVMFWIGDEDPCTTAAFDLTKKLGDLFLKVTREKPEFPPAGAIEQDEYVSDLGLPTLSSGEWWGLMELFQRPVWQRLWVVQEVILGPKVTVNCGTHSLEFEILGQAALYLNASHWIVKLQQHYRLSHPEQHFLIDEHDAIQDIGRVDFISNLYNRRINFQDGSTESFEQLLLSTRRCKTSRWRQDKVYALLGILGASFSNGKIPSILNPSYSTTAEEVFQDVTRYLIDNVSLDILSGVEDMSLRSSDLALPSWVPNFDVFQNSTIIGMPSHIPSTSFTAGGSQAERNPSTLKAGEPNVLHLEACKVDDILLIGPEFIYQTEDNFLEESARLVDIFQPYPTGENIVEAFWRTLVGNFVTTEYPAPKSLLRDFWGFCLQAGANIKLEYEISKLKEEGLIPVPEGMDSLKLISERLLAIPEEYKNFVLLIRSERQDIPIAPFSMHEWAPGLYNVFTKGLLGATILSTGVVPRDLLQNSNGSRFRFALRHWCYFRRCFTTESKGYIGIGPRSLQRGDGVFVLKGGRVPFILRKIADNTYKLVGECYVHGIMHGEALQGKTFELIQIH